MTDFFLKAIDFTAKILVDLYTKSPTFYPAALGAYIAFNSIKNQRQSAREKNSLDFESAYKRNKDIEDAWMAILAIHKDRILFPIENYGKREYGNTENAKSLRTIFNEWERCANAVHSRIYDDLYLYRAHGSTLIFLDVHFGPYMDECRERNPRIYANLKKLALQWRIRRAYEDANGISGEDYKKILKKAQESVDKLPIKFF